ncbi:MAG: hypothetical protein LQ346_005912 [Caloplaca aetnensis]|nr:MAG: hypothetical protein LQ346_005912 [Caloplaca aetnensis]
MPPAADTQPKPLKRHRRKPKSASISQNYSNGLSDDGIHRQLSSDLEPPEQETEPSPPTMFVREPNHHPQDQLNISAGEKVKRTQTPRKKRGSLPNGATPTPKRNSTPRPIHRTISLTPGKKSTTPSQAYAGPTFHASPAASSLPMPRFFSKSVPDINKAPSMQSTMEKEAAEESSEQSEGSPTPVYARRNDEDPARGESPLDIFFRADREQKERLRKEHGASPDVQRVASQPDHDRSRHHSRHSTNGSTCGVFSMDLEPKEPAPASHDESFSEPVAGTVDTNDTKPSPPVGTIETPHEAEQRRAKTMALKKFLLSSATSPKDSQSQPGQSLASNNPTLARNPSPQQPKPSAGPQIYKQLAAQSARQMSPCPRPSSNLRREISASALPDSEPVSELPATPTPSRTRNAYRSAPLQGESSVIFDSAFSSSPVPLSSKRSTPASAPAVSSSPYKSMEDDLRRILKLDVLSGDSAAGVRS